MKLILIFTVAFLILTPTVFSELTVEDIEKIGSLITGSEARLKTDIKESEDHVKEHVDLKNKNCKYQS